ncbi:unnamed protein product [[Candida] boidinii]|nr:unnamed protein product [[Candida] boidinii]
MAVAAVVVEVVVGVEYGVIAVMVVVGFLVLYLENQHVVEEVEFDFVVIVENVVLGVDVDVDVMKFDHLH